MVVMYQKITETVNLRRSPGRMLKVPTAFLQLFMINYGERELKKKLVHFQAEFRENIAVPEESLQLAKIFSKEGRASRYKSDQGIAIRPLLRPPKDLKLFQPSKLLARQN